MRRKTIILSILLLVSLAGFGQREPQYSQYLFNGLAINPAYAGSWDYGTMNLLVRKQWLGMNASPVTASYIFHGPFKDIRHGWGGSLVNDKIGVSNELSLNLAYAYRIRLGDRVRISLGLQGGFRHLRSNWSALDLEDEGDMVFSEGIQNLITPTAGAGVYVFSDRFFAGVSVPNLIHHKLFDPQTQSLIGLRYQMHYLVTGGVVIPVAKWLKLKPTFLLKFHEAAPLNFDVNLSLLFMEKVWFGASWRSFESMIGFLDWRINRNFTVGYAYDFPFSKSLSPFNSGSHEFMVGYNFAAGRKHMVSPRYF